MAVSVKAYLNGRSGSPEIRRFSIPQDVSASFPYLVEKIRQVYSSLLRKDFKLYWQDKDGEYVVFSSDEELVMALGSSTSEDNFRIFIEEIGSNGNGSPNESSQESQAKHPGVVCDVCDKEINGSRFKCLTCPDYDLCSRCESKGFHPEHEMLRIRTPGQNWQGFWPFIFGIGRRNPQCAGRQGPRGHCPPRHGYGRPQRGPHCPGFSPHHHRRGGHCGRGAAEGGFFGPWMSQSWWTNQPNEENKTKGEAKQDQQQDGAQNFTSFQEVFDHVTQALSEQFGMGHPWGPCAETSDNKEKENEKKQEDTTPAATEQSTQAADEDAPMPQSESFVMVNDKQSDGQPKSQEQSETSASPKPQQRRPEEMEFEKKLNDAIKQMENMGFKNDNGWLSQLLIAKDFDIGRVIDILQYRAEKE